MTVEHLRPVFESLSLHVTRFWSMCQSLVRGDIPEEILQVVRMGRITALQKPTGGVRGVVAGDIISLVARTIAQKLGPAIECSTPPFQFVLTTCAGCECIGHILQSETDASPNRTVWKGPRSVALCSTVLEHLPLISRMTWALSTKSTGRRWRAGRRIHAGTLQLGQHGALVAVQEQLGPDERLFAFLDDVDVTPLFS